MFDVLLHYLSLGFSCFFFLTLCFREHICALIERLRIMFTSNGEREFVPPDQISSLLLVYCSLFLQIN